MRKILLSCFVVATLCGNAAFSLQRYVTSTGNDTGNNCSVITNPCLTLQHAIDESVDFDTISISAGFYPVTGLVTVNKTLSILGEQAGIDARSRSGSETIISNSQGMAVSANNVVLDGLVIQDSSNGAYTGFGVWLNPNVDGTIIINNIFQNNIAGLGLANAGASPAIIQQNVFIDNNLAGGASGSGIYTDQYVGGAVANVVISENLFENNQNAAIGLSNTDTSNPSASIVISNNEITNCGRGIYLFSTIDSAIIDNNITNLTVPSDGGLSTAIGIYGGVSNLEILRNNLQNGAQYGVRFNDFIGASPNRGITVHQNNLVGFAGAALHAEEAPLDVDGYATCNWWGDATGPYNDVLNPSGSGSSATGAVLYGDFSPWLSSPGPSGPCGNSPPTVNKTFSPNTVQIGKASTLKIVLGNPNNATANLTAPLIDNLPLGLFVSSFTNNTCGGTVIALPGSSSVILLHGSIPAEGFCKVIVKVKTWSVGNYVNTIPVGGLVTTKGNNVVGTTDTLTAVCNNCTMEEADQE